MSDFTITEVLSQEAFSTANGDFIAYHVRFTGDQGNGEAQHNRKASSPAPVEGETFDGEIQHRNGKANLKRIYKQGGGSNGGGRSPQDTKQIVRQHSQQMALAHALLLDRRGQLGDTYNVEVLKPMIDWFQRDAEGV